jgi:hypothetical protein
MPLYARDLILDEWADAHPGVGPSRGRRATDQQHGENGSIRWEGRQISANRGQGVSTGTTRGRISNSNRNVEAWRVKQIPLASGFLGSQAC